MHTYDESRTISHMISKTVNVNLIEKKEDLFKTHRKDIEDFWEDYRIKNPDSYSEKVLNAIDVNEKDNDFTLIVDWMDFYVALYSKQTGNIKTRTLFSGGYVVTSDGYYCVAVDKNRDINLIGGVSSLKDVKEGRYSPESCLIREFREEIGVDLCSEEFTYKLKYIKAPEGDEIYFPVGLIYEITTTYTKDKLEEIFLNSSHDNELHSLKFFGPEEKEIFSTNTRRPYINELFDLIFEG